MTLPARANVLGGLRNTLGAGSRSAGASENELFDITLSASEAATNAIEHAYGATEATFIVRCEHEANEATITVRDDGRWRTTRPTAAAGGSRSCARSLDDVKDRQRPTRHRRDHHQEALAPTMSAVATRTDRRSPDRARPRRHRRRQRRCRATAARRRARPRHFKPHHRPQRDPLPRQRRLDMLLRLSDRLDHRRAKLILVIPEPHS